MSKTFPQLRLLGTGSWFGCRNETVTAKSSGKCWYPSPQFSLADNKTWWTESGEKYVDALVKALPAGTPGLALWDVVNEPESGGLSHLPGEEKGPRWLFVRHFVKYFQSKTTTGHCGCRERGLPRHYRQRR